VYVLLVTQVIDGVIHTAVGPVYHVRIDALAAARRWPYDQPGTHVNVLERELRGVPLEAVADTVAG